jgi:hypothetical protein
MDEKDRPIAVGATSHFICSTLRPVSMDESERIDRVNDRTTAAHASEQEPWPQDWGNACAKADAVGEPARRPGHPGRPTDPLATARGNPVQSRQNPRDRILRISTWLPSRVVFKTVQSTTLFPNRTRGRGRVPPPFYYPLRAPWVP